MKDVMVFENSGKCLFGGGQKMSLIVAEILNKDHDVIFCDFASHSIYQDKVRESFPLCKRICLHSYYSKLSVKYIRWAVEVFMTLLFAPINIVRIIRNVDKGNTIVYATDKKTLIYAYILNTFCNIPFILHAHLVENSQAFYFRVYKVLARKAQTIICCSKEVQKSITLSNTVLLYNPNMNNRGFKGAKKDNGKFVAVVVGGMIPIKGFEYFVEAAKKCTTEVEFRIYGDGPLRKSLEELSNGRVRFMGFCNNILDELYNDVDVVVLSTIIKEANPLSVLEAKSVGLPVICTNIGGQAEIVNDGMDGYLVPICDSHSIAEKVQLLYNNVDMYNQMAMASYESSTVFDYEKFCRVILILFENKKKYLFK